MNPVLRVFSTPTGLVVEHDGVTLAPARTLSLDTIFQAADPAAEVRAASAERIAQGNQALDGQKNQLDHDRAAADSTVALHDIQMRRELAMLDYANRHQMNLDQVKGELAKTSMTLQMQEKLNAVDNAADLHKHHSPTKPTDVAKPAAQVPGRAPNGHAFEQSA